MSVELTERRLPSMAVKLGHLRKRLEEMRDLPDEELVILDPYCDPCGDDLSGPGYWLIYIGEDDLLLYGDDGKPLIIDDEGRQYDHVDGVGMVPR